MYTVYKLLWQNYNFPIELVTQIHEEVVMSFISYKVIGRAWVITEANVILHLYIKW